MSIPTIEHPQHLETGRDRVNYLISIAFDEQRSQIEFGLDEPAETWLSFLGECALAMSNIKQ